MSSFRIDRQYVAFETAETQPVHAAAKVQEPEPDRPADKSVDISKLYDEIYDRLQREHAEQAEYMLSKAADEAQEIISKARKQAEELTRLAKDEARRMEEELTARMEATDAERRSRSENEILELETRLKSDYTELVDGMRGKVVALVMDIVKKIIGIKLAESDEIFTELIRDALERLKQTDSVLIRVGPEDYARYFVDTRGDGGSGTILEALDEVEVKITAVEEPDFSQGDLIVESEGEMIDLSINRQLGLIEDAFSN